MPGPVDLTTHTHSFEAQVLDWPYRTHGMQIKICVLKKRDLPAVILHPKGVWFPTSNATIALISTQPLDFPTKMSRYHKIGKYLTVFIRI